MQQKKKEYETAKSTPIVGALRATVTRYEEKRNFILREIIPVIQACKENATEDNKHALAKKFSGGKT